MKISKFFNSIEEATRENQYLKYLAILESIALILSFIVLGGKEVVVVQQPNGLTKDITVSEDKGSDSYKEQWALSMAELIGNVTPSNADFIENRIIAYFEPGLFQKMKTDIEEQVLTLKHEQATISFLPKSIIYEPKTGFVYVNGNKEIHSYGVKSKQITWTMEFGIRVLNYLPVVYHFDAYSGLPKTKEVRDLEKQEKGRV